MHALDAGKWKGNESKASYETACRMEILKQQLLASSADFWLKKGDRCGCERLVVCIIIYNWLDSSEVVIGTVARCTLRNYCFKVVES